MKTINKANVNSSAITVPSIAGDKFGVEMRLFVRKDLNTLKETVVLSLLFKDKKGDIEQSEDIIVTNGKVLNLDDYSPLLKKSVPIVNISGQRTSTNCIKELKKFLREYSDKIPVRYYYDKGHGWSIDSATKKLRFDGSSVIPFKGTLDDNQHHLVKRGAMKKTIDICNEVMDGRLISQFLIAMSLAAPIYGALGLKSLIANICGLSSQGKTILLKLCMSLWDNPEGERLSNTWNNTENAISALLNNLEGVPFLLDDTSQGKIKNFTDILYNIEDGKSKGRLNKEYSVDSRCSWHTCIFSASENSVYEKTDSDKMGILRRLVEIEVEQGDLLKDAAQAAKVKKTCKENYGHVGMYFVNELFKHKMTENDFKKLKESLHEEEKEISMDGNGISKGITEKLVVVLLAAKLGEQYLGLKFDLDGLTEYIQTLIAETVVKVEQVIKVKVKQDFDTCYRELCTFAETKLSSGYIRDFVYYIPSPLFNVLESKLGYNYRELRELLMEKRFIAESDDEALDKTIRRPDKKQGETATLKVIAITKMI
ncbi:DUF927 domain-containing protein [Clostridium sp. CX1]|uniref:DUF927 domain-containing protein n=1 Tax=Clostridium sp. CX1 TaxID=2978346 RepID=UPI0021BF9370|nr:DUF927 domain-containing protein [Clostridium sp. CX1]MCT8974977.1 DUF927 domain-containing protein [Clostridium sp. CX1]